MTGRRPATAKERGAGASSSRAAVSQDPPIVLIERALADMSRLFTSQRVHEERMTASGVQISRTDLRCLTLVDRLGPVSVTKLANIMDLSQATASRAIASLEAGGYLARSADPGDGRVTYCTTTAMGRRALHRIQRFMYGQLNEALSGMSLHRQRDLASTLTELVELLQTAPLRTSTGPDKPDSDASAPTPSTPSASSEDASGQEGSTS
jgi:DNA-binding MarR family transcriptional regulator